MGGKTSKGGRVSTPPALPRSIGDGAIDPLSKDGLAGGPVGDGTGCDIHLSVDLASVRAVVISGLRTGDDLDVALRSVEGYEAVACLHRPSGGVAGTLANVEGLDRLIGCLKAGHRYRAIVTEVGPLRCHVVVDPVLA